jgi:Zn-dependent peptidase ImmA (M78 family)/transcriptional regulator with XRE-family HTH domain
MIGSRLKLARDGAGLSLRALAARIENRVTPQAIGRYERNEMMPSSGVLLALASALHVSPDYLMEQRQIRLGGIEFRKATNASAKEEKAVAAQVVENLERHILVEDALGLPIPDWRSPLADLEPVQDESGAFAAADTLRVRWQLGTDPIPSMTELLEERGIKVIALPLASTVFGSKAIASVAERPGIPAIIINAVHTGERQRFTLAHELGHLAMSVAPDMTNRAAEKLIDRFAGAFLVHREELRRLVGLRRNDVSLGELVELKSHFRVSLQCLVLRLGQCGVLSSADTSRHWQMLKDHGYLAPPYAEPMPLPAERSHRLHRLVMRAVSEGALEEPRAAELLRVSVRSLTRWLDEGAHAELA